MLRESKSYHEVKALLDADKNTARKMRMNVVKLVMGVIFFFSFMSMACDDNPCANGSACGLTSPHTSAEQSVINMFDNDKTDNALP